MSYIDSTRAFSRSVKSMEKVNVIGKKEIIIITIIILTTILIAVGIGYLRHKDQNYKEVIPPPPEDDSDTESEYDYVTDDE
jgi:hypothetical protein